MSWFLHILSWLPLIAALIVVALLAFVFRPALKLCDLFPGSAWALAVIVLVGMLCTGLLQVAAVRSERDAAKREAIAQSKRAEALQTSVNTLERAIETQKKEAQAKYDALKADADRKQEAINLFTKAQEVKDASNKDTVDRYSRQLAAVRLRDPYATGCGPSGGSAKGAAGAATDGRAADGSDATGVLSERTSQDIRRLERIADQVNIAYASCRAQLIDDRAVLGTPAAK